MSRNYDNWERLVAAVIKREEDWQLCHQLSIRTTSICSQASSVSDSSSELESDEESAQKPVPLNSTYQLKMKKRIVLKVSVNDVKSRTKALRISVNLSGVQSVSLTGPEKDQLVVVGEDIDPVALVRLLRNNIFRRIRNSRGAVFQFWRFSCNPLSYTRSAPFFAELLSVGPYLPQYPDHEEDQTCTTIDACNN